MSLMFSFSKRLFFALFFSLFLCVPTFASTIARPMSNSGLVGYWNFEEGIGNTTVYDRSGFGSVGAMTNMNVSTAWVNSSTTGQALSFDGNNDWVNVNDSAALDNGVSKITLVAWFKTNSVVGTKAIMTKGSSGQAFNYGIGLSGTGLYSRHHAGDVITNAITVTAGVWHQLVLVNIGGIDYFYYDGVLVDSKSGTASGANDFPLSIGATCVGLACATQSEFFNGSIDEVRVYNRALSSDEVSRLYKLQKPRVTGGINNSGLAGYWSLDDGVGTRAEDASFNSNNGTLTNSPTWVNGKNGKALNFVGASSQYVSIPSSLGLNTTNFTVVGWAYRANTGDHGAFIKIGGIVGGVGIGVSPNNTNGFETSGDTLTVLYESARWIPTGQNFGTGWHQFALVIDSSGFPTVYYDGRSVYNDSTGGPTSPGSALTQIGGYTSGIATNRFFTGAVDDIRVYNRALTSTEIYNLFTGSKASVVNKSKPERLSNGLVGYWTFDGNKMAGVTAYDSSSSGNNGTMTNGPIPTLGKVGQALNFDGSDDYVAFNSGYTLGNFSTVSAWINLNNTSGIQTITQGTTATRYFIWNSTQFQYSENTVTFSSGNVSITPGQWYHVAAVRDTAAVEIVSFYVNGVLISSSTAAIQNQNFFNYINSPTAGRVLNGKIDEVRIYNRSLSADEIKALYNVGK